MPAPMTNPRRRWTAGREVAGNPLRQHLTPLVVPFIPSLDPLTGFGIASFGASSFGG